MALECTICTHSERAIIDALLRSGTTSNRRIAALYAMDESNVRRHKKNHLRPQGQEPPQPQSVQSTQQQATQAHEVDTDTQERQNTAMSQKPFQPETHPLTDPAGLGFYYQSAHGVQYFAVPLKDHPTDEERADAQIMLAYHKKRIQRDVGPIVPEPDYVVHSDRNVAAVAAEETPGEKMVRLKREKAQKDKEIAEVEKQLMDEYERNAVQAEEDARAKQIRDHDNREAQARIQRDFPNAR